MYFAYVDESGKGTHKNTETPIFALVGILLNEYNSHKMRRDWNDILDRASEIAKKTINEIHAYELFRGEGAWKDMGKDSRLDIARECFSYINNTKLKIFYTAVEKEAFSNLTPKHFNDIQDYAMSHLFLAIEKHMHQKGKKDKNKRKTLFIFDKDRHQISSDIDEFLYNPPTDKLRSYCNYSYSNFQYVLDEPVFSRSHRSILLQMADLVVFHLRRYLHNYLRKEDIEDYDMKQDTFREYLRLIRGRVVKKSMLWKKGTYYLKTVPNVFYELDKLFHQKS